jgi:hypothetical protein
VAAVLPTAAVIVGRFWTPIKEDSRFAIAVNPAAQSGVEVLEAAGYPAAPKPTFVRLSTRLIPALFGQNA